MGLHNPQQLLTKMATRVQKVMLQPIVRMIFDYKTVF